MVTITQSDITITADTAPLALRELRKATAKRNREYKQEQADHAQAVLVAHSHAFNVMRRIMERDEMPRGFRVFRCRGGSAVTATRESSGVFQLSIQTCNGRASCTAYGSAILGALENGSGEPMLIWIQNRLSDQPDVFAIGCHNGRAALYPVPNSITIDLFRAIED